MNYNFKEVKEIEKIGKIEREFDFTVVDQLPSGFRCYKDLNHVYVRGLFYAETMALSKVKTDNLKQIISIYRDSIKFRNPDFRLEDLEFADFLLLITIVNIQTVGPKYGWNTGIKCKNMIKNKNIEEIKEKLEFLNDIKEELPKKIKETDDENIINNLNKKISSINDEIEEKNKEIEELILNEGNIIQCNTNITSPITLSDLDFVIEDDDVEVPQEILLGTFRYNLSPLKVSDYILYKEEYFENNDDKLIFNKALFIDSDLDIETKIDIVKYMTPQEADEFNSIIDRFNIKLNMVEKSCNNCGKVHKVKIGLTKLKVYP
jgi:hypothetical protein